jgi:hypothetical protein
VLQFLAESILTALLSAVVALIWVYLLLPAFNNITGKALGLDLNYSVLSSLLLITLIAGLIAGSYPALYLSRFKPVDVLKGQSRPFGSDALVRKGLVVFQFAISIILIVAVLVVKRQVDFIQSKNLGYSTDHIIYFGKGGEVNGNKESDMEAFIHELKAIPGVVNAANLGYDITGSNGTTSLSWTGKNPDNQTQFHMLHAGYDLLETLNYKLVEGRTFPGRLGLQKSQRLYSIYCGPVMRLTDPVGKTVKWGDKSYEIIGVVEDFNFESVYEKVKPCFFDLVPGYSNVVVKISAGKEKKTINQLQQYYKAEVGFTLNFKFLNEQYQKLYEAETALQLYRNTLPVSPFLFPASVCLAWLPLRQRKGVRRSACAKCWVRPFCKLCSCFQRLLAFSGDSHFHRISNCNLGLQQLAPGLCIQRAN